MSHWLYKTIIVLIFFILNNCMLTQNGYSAPIGILYQDSTINHVFPKGTDLGSRMGTSCVESYGGLWSVGDAGIRASAAEGGITTIRAVDYRIQNISFLYMKTCTITYGE